MHKQYDQVMCTHGPESELYSGLHKKKDGQQIKGGDSSSLLCSCETLSEVLHPALGSSAQESHEPVAASPEKGCRDDQRAGAPVELR